MIGTEIFTSEEVIFYDTDSGGVVSNIAYLRYVEKARCRLFAELGMDLKSMNETLLFPTVVRSEIDYRKPARLGNELKVSAKLASVEKLRITCEFRVESAKTDSPDLFAEAVQTVVLVQMPDGKPARPPREWRS